MKREGVWISQEYFNNLQYCHELARLWYLEDRKCSGIVTQDGGQ